MSTDIAKKTEFDPRDLAERLRDKIRVDMADLMPDEMWEGLLEKELKTFFEPKVIKSGYRNEDSKTVPSPFSVLVHGEIESLVKDKLTERIRVKLGAEVDKRTGELDTTVMKFIEANAGRLLESWFAGAMFSQLSMHANNIRFNAPGYNEQGQKVDGYGNVVY